MKKLSSILITAIIVASCGGNEFNEVKIGNQVWMSQNLNVDKFRNGDAILYAETIEEWLNAGINHQPAWCYPDNNPQNGEKYGKLYNWYAVSDPRGLAPSGYHVPSDDEWTILEEYLISLEGTKMKSNSGWKEEGNGTNSTGFSGLPGGSRAPNGTFSVFKFGSHGFWWSSTEHSSVLVWARSLSYHKDDCYRLADTKESGFSVRCLRD